MIQLKGSLHELKSKVGLLKNWLPNKFDLHFIHHIWHSPLLLLLLLLLLFELLAFTMFITVCSAMRMKEANPNAENWDPGGQKLVEDVLARPTSSSTAVARLRVVQRTRLTLTDLLICSAPTWLAGLLGQPGDSSVTRPHQIITL